MLLRPITRHVCPHRCLRTLCNGRHPLEVRVTNSARRQRPSCPPSADHGQGDGIAQIVTRSALGEPAAHRTGGRGTRGASLGALSPPHGTPLTTSIRRAYGSPLRATSQARGSQRHSHTRPHRAAGLEGKGRSHQGAAELVAPDRGLREMELDRGKVYSRTLKKAKEGDHDSGLEARRTIVLCTR